MAHSNYGELRQLFETFTRVWEAGGQTSLHLHTKDGQARAMLELQLGPPGDPHPGAPDVRGEAPGPENGPHHYPHQQHPRRCGPAARARDAARRETWLRKKQDGHQEEPAENDTVEICPDTETVSASSNDLVEVIEAETLDSDISDAIPQLDGPAEDKEVKEEDSVKEEEIDLAHLPTADDPASFDYFLNNLDQEKIEKMSKQELNHINAEIARKVAFQNATKKKKKPNKCKHGKI